MSIIVNDPWLLAGHLNDVCVLSPVFYKDRIVAFTACVFHHSDIGGRVASDNREVYEEGLFIPPLKALRSRRAQRIRIEPDPLECAHARGGHWRYSFPGGIQSRLRAKSG